MNAPIDASPTEIMRQVVAMAWRNRKHGQGRPFAAVVADETRVVGEGVNTIHRSHDLSAHAEMEAIRASCRQRQSASLAGLTVYASGHPCPMCLAAIVAGGAKQVFYAFDNADAAPYGLSSEETYQRLGLRLDPPPLPIARIDTGITAAQLYGDAPWPDAPT